MAVSYKGEKLVSDSRGQKLGQINMEISGTSVPIRPRDPITGQPAIINPAQTVYQGLDLDSMNTRNTKERISYSGGFKIPEEMRGGKKGTMEEGMMGSMAERDQGRALGYISKHEVLRDLDLVAPSGYEKLGTSSKMGETRGAMTTDMLKSIEREVEKLKIQSENLKMRRSFAKGESDEQEYMAREATIRQEVGEKATHLIHAGQERIQVMQHIPSHVGIEHLNYDQLTTLRKEHELKMATVADEYYRKKQSESMNFSHPNRVSQQGIIKGGKSSDPLNYPTYGRGVDPGPDMNSYMLKEGLGDVGHGGFKSRPRKTDISEKKPLQFRDSTRSYGRSPQKSQIKSPDRIRYERKFNDYMTGKEQDLEEIEPIEGSPERKGDWDKYTSGPESWHIKGKELKEMYDHTGLKSHCKFSTYDALNEMNLSREQMRDSKEFDDVPMEEDDKKTYLLLRWIFNTLDSEGTDKVRKSRLLDELFKQENMTILDLFEIKNREDFEDFIQGKPVKDKGYLNWEEFLETLFLHQVEKRKEHQRQIKNYRSVSGKRGKQPMSQIKEEYREDLERDDYDDDGYTSDPEMKLRTGPPAKYKKRSKTPGRRVTRGRSGSDERIPEGDIKNMRLTGVDYKKHYSKTPKPHTQTQKTPKSDDFLITVPDPFSFTARDSNRMKTIREEKVEEMVNEKKIEEENMIHHRFTANSIPEEVLVPRYDSIMAANEERRQRIKEESYLLTKQREQPFTFYARDKNKLVDRAKYSEEHIPECMRQPAFKANPIPWNVTAPLYKQMIDKENQEREQKHTKRARETLLNSKLPPRMEMHQKLKEQEVLNALKSNKSVGTLRPEPHTYGYKPDRSKQKDNWGQYFRVQQRVFQKTLDKKKQQQEKTVPQPFNFKESKREAKLMDYMNYENKPDLKHSGLKLAMMSKTIDALKKPNINPPTTTKTTMAQEKRRKEIEAQRTNEEVKFKEQVDRHAKQTRLTSRVKNSNALEDNRKVLEEQNKKKIDEHKQKQKQGTKAYQDRLNAMNERVKNRPLLMEQVSSGSKNLQRMKALAKVDHALQEAGIKEHNRDQYFEGDEKDVVDDARYLQKKGILKSEQ